MTVAHDQWSKWLLETQFGGDAEAADRAMQHLRRVRDRVLDTARIKEGDTLLDVGCGDGLIAFGALDRVGDGGRVIFSDISAPLLDHCHKLAREFAMPERCEFVEASADDLAAVADASVDVVTTRSVLIYVKEKSRAFAEFHRVLRPGGRVSLFEPINSFRCDSEDELWGVDVRPVRELAARVRAVFRDINPVDGPMMNFDERDLVAMAEDAGFTWIQLRLDINVGLRAPSTDSVPSWEALVNAPPNPLAPSLLEAMGRVLSEDERARLTDHMRRRVESGLVADRRAVAYLQATKAGTDA